MDQHELEGRLAALEFVAAISLRNTFIRWWASAYTARLPFLSEWIAEQIEAGTMPGPSDPAARNEMKKAVLAIINTPEYIDRQNLRLISERHDQHHSNSDQTST